MKKKRSNSEGNHYYIQWAIATLILFVYVVGTLLSYDKTMRQITEERAIDRISKQAVQLRGFYEGKLSGTKELAVVVADFAATKDDIYDEEVLNLLSTMVNKGGLKMAYVVKPGGLAVDNTGKEYVSLDNSEDYQEMMNGKRSICAKSDSDGNVSILVAAPISDGQSVKGHIVLSYSPDNMNKIINTPIYSYNLVFDDGYVAEELGDSIICSAGDNLLDAIKNMTFVSGTYSVFSHGLSGNKSVTSIVKNSDGENYYLIAQPIENMNSEIVIIFNEDHVDRNSYNDNHVTSAMISKLLISLVLFIVLMFIIYMINRIAFSKTNKELKDKAETDLLTGLLNKVSTENKIKEYLAEEGKSKTSLMCVLDIDNFKKINDTMGHSFGDEVLASLGKQIGSEFRVTDIIGRTGGDEFIIFLKDLKDVEIMRRESERVATFFKNFTVGDYTKYSATASIGVAVYPRDGEDFDTLYKAADSALYKAKNRGKNQMAFYKEI